MALGTSRPATAVVAFGHNSGGEIGFSDGRSRRSVDWVLAKVQNGHPSELVGIEVQSIDTTGNYLANRDAYLALHEGADVAVIPNTSHGLNFANVWKRLIPQIILKGPAFAASALCTKGLYFVLPEEVYRRFEDTAPNIPTIATQSKDTVTVYTYTLDRPVAHGSIRNLVQQRRLVYRLADLIAAFTERDAANLGEQIDAQVRRYFHRASDK